MYENIVKFPEWKVGWGGGGGVGGKTLKTFRGRSIGYFLELDIVVSISKGVIWFVQGLVVDLEFFLVVKIMCDKFLYLTFYSIFTF